MIVISLSPASTADPVIAAAAAVGVVPAVGDAVGRRQRRRRRIPHAHAPLPVGVLERATPALAVRAIGRARDAHPLGLGAAPHAAAPGRIRRTRHDAARLREPAALDDAVEIDALPLVIVGQARVALFAGVGFAVNRGRGRPRAGEEERYWQSCAEQLPMEESGLSPLYFWQHWPALTQQSGSYASPVQPGGCALTSTQAPHSPSGPQLCWPQ